MRRSVTHSVPADRSTADGDGGARNRRRHPRLGLRHVRHGRGGVGLDVLSAPPAVAPPAIVADPVWAARLRRLAQRGAWALPVHALILLWLSLAVPLTDRTPPPLVSVACWWLGLVAVVAVAALLAGMRGWPWAVLGLLAGSAGMTLTVAAGHDPAAPAPAAAALVSLGWLLLGGALWLSRPDRRAEALLLLLAAPALFLVVTPLTLLVPLGALLLAAGGIGIAWHSGRLVPDRV